MACFYARVTAVDGRGILASVGALAGRAGVSISSVSRARGGDGGGGGKVDWVLKTDACNRSKVVVFLESLNGEEWTKGEAVLLSIL